MTSVIKQFKIIDADLSGQRLDVVLKQLFPEYSRTQLQQSIKAGDVRVDGVVKPAKYQCLGNEQVSFTAPQVVLLEDKPQAIPLEIIFEDDVILVINKPAGLVVHPGAGQPDNTLLNALLAHCPDNKQLSRAGIVHRLDKDTSGLLVVAKTPDAQSKLIAQLADHSVQRLYQAISCGHMVSGTTISTPIGRHPKNRVKMAVNQIGGGKPSVTHVRVLERFGDFNHVECQLETGRTHQIRVHMAHIGHPLFGDQVYGQRLRLPKNAGTALVDILRNFKRQALHAAQLGLLHPKTNEHMSWTVAPPKDYAQLLLLLREYADLHQND